MKKLSIVIPVYNEKGTVRALFEALVKVDFQSMGFDREILFIDDYSTDGTRDILKELAEDEGVSVTYQHKNQGKGAALRAGFQQATGDFVVVQDADLEYNPEDFLLLLDVVQKFDADVVYGSRFASDGPRKILNFWHYLGNTFLTTISNLFSGWNLTDMETCYKMVRRDVLQKINLHENRFGIEPELTAKLAKFKHLKVYEVPIFYLGRSYDEGKKIGWRDGVRAIYCIIKYNLSKKT